MWVGRLEYSRASTFGSQPLDLIAGITAVSNHEQSPYTMPKGPLNHFAKAWRRKGAGGRGKTESLTTKPEGINLLAHAKPQ